MSQKQFASLPQWIDIRIVRYTTQRRGYRTKHVAMRYLTLRLQQLPGVARLLLNPHRRARRQLRVIRRRMKEYDLLTEPRTERIDQILREEMLK